MADPQTSSPQPSGSLPASLINPDDMSYFNQPGTGTAAPKLTPTPVVFTPPNPIATTNQQAPAPAPQPAVQPQPPLQPATAPAVASPTPLQPPPAAAPAAPATAKPPQQAPRYVAVGDSLAAGIAQTRKFNQTYDVHDEPAAKANPSIMAASGRTTDQTLATINANPQQFAGANVSLSTGMSNDLMGGRPLDDAMTNVASQLDALRKAGANVVLAGVGSGVPGYQQANARLAQIAKAYNIPFTGEPATTQGGRVHPSDYNAFYGQFHFGQQQPGGQQQPQQQPESGAAGVRQDIINFWTSKGVPQHVAEGIAANASIESSFIPGAYNPDDKGSPSAGLFQAHAERLASLEKAVPDWRTNVAGQMQWAWDQVHGGDADATAHWNEIMNAPNAQTAGMLWRLYFERPANVDSQEIANALNPDLSSGALMRQYHDGVQAQKDLNAQQLAILQKEFDSLGQEDPKRRALMDQILQTRLDDMKLEREKLLHPPTLQPVDALKNFGSLATLIGIFAGRFAHRPMVASLDAAGAAMQAMNDQNYDQYKTQFDIWKTQIDLFGKVVDMEHQAYADILDDKKTTDAEKWHQMEIQTAIFQNQQARAALAASDPEKLLTIQKTIEETKESIAKTGEYLTKANDEAEKSRVFKAAVAQDDQQWIKDNPERYQAWIKDHPERVGTVPPDVGFDNLTRRQAQLKSASKAGSEEAIQVTWDDGRTEVLYGQRGAPGHFVTDGGRDVDISGAQSVLPMTKSQAGTVAAAATISPSTVEFWANVLRNGGSLPPGLSRGPQGAALVKAIMDKVPELAQAGETPGDFVARQASRKADQASLTNMQKMADASAAFENTAIRNFGVALNLSKDAVPTDWGPWLNKWIMDGETGMGDPNVPAYVAALLTGANEYAKIMNGATGSQGSTVDSRREAATMFSPYLSAGQIDRVVAIAKTDMENRKGQNYQQVEEIKSRISGRPAEEPKSGGGGTSTPLPAGVPQGSVLAGTKDGHPVYKTPDGKLLQVQP